jgi:peptide/nickel transport system substrate-binding protein
MSHTLRHGRRLGVALLVTIVTIAASCGDSGGGAKTSAATTAGGAAASTVPATTAPVAIDPDASIVIGNTFLATTLDPQLANTNSAGNNWLYDRLINFDGTDRTKLNPGLATSWEVSDDQKTLTFHLRAGVTFNDGTPFDGTAVQKSFERGKTLPGSIAASTLAEITAIDLPDPMTVKLTLSIADATLVQMLATPRGAIISPKAIDAKTDLSSSDHGAGTTPYQVAAFTSGQLFAVERRPDARPYWDPNAWKLKRIEVRNVTDGDAQLNGLATGALDIASLTSPAAQAQRVTSSGVKLYPIDSTTVMTFNMRDTRAGFASQDVRRAIAQAVNFKALADSGALGDCTYSSQLLTPGDPGYIQGYAPLPFDAAKAKAVLTKPFSFELTVTSNPRDSAAGQYIQEQLKPYGIDVKLVTRTLTEALKSFGDGSLDAYASANGRTGPDATSMLNNAYLQFYNAAGAQQKAGIAATINQINAMKLGSDQRKAALEQLNRDTQEQAWEIPICLTQTLWGVSSKMVGPPVGWAQNSFDARYWAVRKS